MPAPGNGRLGADEELQPHLDAAGGRGAFAAFAALDENGHERLTLDELRAGRARANAAAPRAAARPLRTRRCQA